MKRLMEDAAALQVDEIHYSSSTDIGVGEGKATGFGRWY